MKIRVQPARRRFAARALAWSAWPAAAALAAVLAGCALTPAERRAALLRRRLAEPARNRWPLPEIPPPAGTRAVFERAGGGRWAVEVGGRAGGRTQLRVAWLAAPAGPDVLTDVAVHYEVDDHGAVHAARLEDATDGRLAALRIALPDEPGYLTQPTVLRLPAPEFADTGRRRVRVDALLVETRRSADGERTQIHRLSDEVPLRVVRTDAVPASVLDVSAVVRLVAAAGEGGAAPAVGTALAARLDGAPGATTDRLLEE